MRLSELAEKRIINIFDGELWGLVGDSDLLIDPDSGRVVELLVPQGKGRRNSGRQLSVPWSAVKKIGSEVVVIDMEEPPSYLR